MVGLLFKILNTIFNSILVKNSFFSLVGTIISRGLILLSWLLIARLVTLEEYGEIGLLRSTFNTLLVFGNIGIGIYATKEISKYKDDTDKCSQKVSFILLFGIFVNIIAFALAAIFTSYVSNGVFKSADTIAMFNNAYLVVPFALMSMLLIGVISGFEKYKDLAKINSLYGLISFLSLIIAASTGSKSTIINTFYSLFILQFILFTYYFYNFIIKNKIHVYINHENFKIELGIAIKFCTPGFLAGLLYVPVRWYCETLIHSGEDGNNELGIFYAAQLFHILFIMLAYNISLPIFTKISSGKITDNLRLINMHLNWQLGALIVIPFLLFPNLAILLFGDNFDDSDFLQVFYLTVGYTIVFMYKQGVGRIIAADGKMWLFLFDNIVFALTLLVAFNLYEHNSIGLSISYLIANTVSSFFFISLYKKKLGLKNSEVFSMEFLLAALIIGTAMVIAVNSQNLLIVIPVNLTLSMFLLFLLSKKYICMFKELK